MGHPFDVDSTISALIDDFRRARERVFLALSFPESANAQYATTVRELAAAVSSQVPRSLLFFYEPNYRSSAPAKMSSNSSHNPHLQETLSHLGNAGWDVRETLRVIRHDVIKVDRQPPFINSGPYHGLAPADVEAQVLGGDALWHKAYDLFAEAGPYSVDDTQLMFASPGSVADANVRSSLVSIADNWSDTIQRLSRSPEDLKTFDRRLFEELVAELMVRDGCDATVTRYTRDGGFDIYAVRDTDYGRHLYLVQCKRPDPENPVRCDVVQRLYGVVEERKATAGLIVTTTRFTADALSYVGRLEYRMGLRDYGALAEWIRKHARFIG